MGLFKDETAVKQALANVERQGVVRQKVSVLSSIPFPDGTFGTDVAPSRLPYISFFGAVGGFFAGFALAAGTALLYPLPTGGKPIVSLPTVAVITYEVTMLGIILFTLFGVLYEMRLPTPKRPPYDSRIGEGYIGVAVPAESLAQATEFEEIMRESGAIEIKRYGEGK